MAQSRNDCTPCGPGYRRLMKCPLTNQACIPCEEGTFNNNSNFHDQCTPCTAQCTKTYELIIGRCEQGATQDVTCQCQPGFWLRTPHELSCEGHKSCAPGYGASVLGTPTSDTVCEPCRAGTFSARSSPEDQCIPHTDCTMLGGIQRAGDTQADNICASHTPSQRATLQSYEVALIATSCTVFLLIVVLAFVCYRVLKRQGRWGHINCRKKKEGPSNNTGEVLNLELPPSYGEVAMNNLSEGEHTHSGSPLMISMANIPGECDSGHADISFGETKAVCRSNRSTT